MGLTSIRDCVNIERDLDDRCLNSTRHSTSAVFKTHIDIVSDFSEKTVQGLMDLSEKHNFMIFENRKFVDIGNTVQKQYRGGTLQISDWAHLVNASVLAGDGIIEALS